MGRRRSEGVQEIRRKLAEEGRSGLGMMFERIRSTETKPEASVPPTPVSSRVEPLDTREAVQREERMRTRVSHYPRTVSFPEHVLRMKEELVNNRLLVSNWSAFVVSAVVREIRERFPEVFSYVVSLFTAETSRV